MSIKNNTTSLQNILNAVNNLPSVDNIELPELITPATEDEVFLNQEYIDANGVKRKGVFTIDAELDAQDDLIAQLQVLVAQKATFNTVYISTTVPTNDIGVDGDLCIVRGGS